MVPLLMSAALHHRPADPSDFDALVSNRIAFDNLIYLSLPEALAELQRRRSDETLEKKVLALLEGDIPAPLRKEPHAVLFRDVLTPNHETRRFADICDQLGLAPLFWEYHEDKFSPNNELKRTTGKLYFEAGTGRNGGRRIESLNVLDFNASNGRRISSLTTLWGQPFVDFHHEFFEASFRPIRNSTFDASEWFSTHGQTSAVYYKPFLALFVRHGILFENIMLDAREMFFTRHVFLPSFISVYAELGLKPLIVPIEPTDVEGDHYWMCHPAASRKFVEQKLKPSGGSCGSNG